MTQIIKITNDYWGEKSSDSEYWSYEQVTERDRLENVEDYGHYNGELDEDALDFIRGKTDILYSEYEDRDWDDPSGVYIEVTTIEKEIDNISKEANDKIEKLKNLP